MLKKIIIAIVSTLIFAFILAIFQAPGQMTDFILFHFIFCLPGTLILGIGTSLAIDTIASHMNAGNFITTLLYVLFGGIIGAAYALLTIGRMFNAGNIDVFNVATIVSLSTCCLMISKFKNQN
ncbi:MAG: hypothetical protein ACE3JN_13115 [Ectobacillus sp.]